LHIKLRVVPKDTGNKESHPQYHVNPSGNQKKRAFSRSVFSVRIRLDQILKHFYFLPIPVPKGSGVRTTLENNLLKRRVCAHLSSNKIEGEAAEGLALLGSPKS
jgi:hypothetical protein